MLTENRHLQAESTNPLVNALVKTIRQLPQDDFDDLIDLMQCTKRTDDQEEYDSLIRAIKEILEQEPIAAHPFLLADNPMTPGLKQWAEHVGGKIRELRNQAGMTQTDLATAAGLTQSHISRLENAEHSATHLTLTKIAKALGVEVGDLDPCAD